MDLIKHVADSFGFVRDMMAERPSPQRTDLKYALLADYFQAAYETKQRGEPLAWVNFATIPELFWAMDLVPVYIDALIGPATTFVKEGITEYVDIAEAVIPDYVCATNKGFLGGILKGDIPVPDLLVHAGHPCDSNVGTYPVIAEQFGFPYFCIDAPYWRDERGMRHMVSELERLVAFLEQTTGKKLDEEKLRQVVEHSNRAHEFILKTNELKMAVPAPSSAIESNGDYLASLCLPGTPALVDYWELRCQALQGKVDRGEGALPEEKLRLGFIFGAPAYDPTLPMWLEKTYEATTMLLPNNVLAKPIEDISSTESIMRGLAQKLVSLPMGKECGGPWENYANTVIEFCADFKADAAIFMNNPGCQHNWPLTKLVRDKIYDELGIQTLVIEVDFFDPRPNPPETVKARIEEFLNVIIGV